MIKIESIKNNYWTSSVSIVRNLRDTAQHFTRSPEQSHIKGPKIIKDDSIKTRWIGALHMTKSIYDNITVLQLYNHTNP